MAFFSRPKTPPKITEANKAYVARQKERGMAQIKLWVPAPLVAHFHDLADKARIEARKGATE
jgi:hypothetical protein